MNEYKIKNLSAKISDFSINDRDFARRVQSGHLFTSIDECLEYLSCIIHNKRINPDDMFYISAEKSPVLYLNIVDSASCAMVYEAFLLINRKDDDAIAYNRYKLDNLLDSIIKERDSLLEMDKYDTRINVLNSIWSLLYEISVILTPIKDHKEELSYGKLSLYYYNAMYTVSSYLYSKGKEKDYFERLIQLYFRYFTESYREYTSMGYRE